MQKILIIIGIVILIIGLFYPHLKKLGLGKLPGDIILIILKYKWLFIWN